MVYAKVLYFSSISHESTVLSDKSGKLFYDFKIKGIYYLFTGLKSVDLYIYISNNKKKTKANIKAHYNTGISSKEILAILNNVVKRSLACLLKEGQPSLALS